VCVCVCVDDMDEAEIASSLARVPTAAASWLHHCRSETGFGSAIAAAAEH
jgi:hypothetical protein